MVIAVDSYHVGNVYQGEIDDKDNVIFVKDASGKPLLTAP